ncbi:MAG: transcription-repair coupling factor, partial [Pelagibacterales bacterium]|nr:transcription-repair coupling factor [Pelagibacterales bacterium]
MDYKVKLKQIKESCSIVKTPQDAQGFLTAQIANNFLKNDLVFVAENDAQMEVLQKQLLFFSENQDYEILNFYAWDCLPYDRSSPKPIISSNRIKTLYKLATRPENKRFFIITSINSILQKTITQSQIQNFGLYLQVGSKNSLNQIAEFLINKGYNRMSCANSVGEFAMRGGIIDIVLESAGDLIGYRIDFFGDEVESIKTFDPITQLSEESVRSVEILPSSEVILNKKTVENFRQKYRQSFGAAIDDQIYSAISDCRQHIGMEHYLPFFYEENLVDIFSYLKSPVIFSDSKILTQAQQREEIIKEYYDARIVENKIKNGTIYNAIKSDLLYLNSQEIKTILQKNIHIEFNQFEESDKNKRIIDLEIKITPDFALAGRANSKDPINLMNEFVTSFEKGFAFSTSEDGGFKNNLHKTPNSDLASFKSPLIAQSTMPSSFSKRVKIACLSEGFKDRISKILFDYGVNCQEVETFSESNSVSNKKTSIFVLPLNHGFYTTDFILIGEQAIFGEKVVRKKNNKATSQRLLEEGLTIQIGELVVHRDHGIGKFDGIHTITAGGIKTDMIKVLYGGNDTLFVPVDDINLISRYGADNPLIQLDRLGVAAWKNRREKVKKKIKIAAEELLKIAAARHLRKANIFIPEQHFYDEFKARFGFVETQDQLRAIEEVEEDLAKGSPMDRLICGDVGFGKTEVALRAAAIVVSDNKKTQVAVITPTTLLCRQHYKNFLKRFEGTDIKVAQLSRLVSAGNSKIIKEEIENGKVDIIVGTHSLLQKNIKFKNLGLAIIDEEQHFGVAQKERIKELRNEVHILTLSATPIPRTLQMSLTGVKDLSLIATPPLDRIAVRNFVMPYDSVITREAIMREYNRGGKTFFVVPRISDIEDMEPRLKILLPELKITHAHGQMTPNQLDQIMNDFVDGKIDVLLSTTIIESGIDISDANTMIIYKAEMFGLAQLYQLRGRVGRGKIRAYSYFMLDNRKKLSDESRKKLEVMQNLDSLGVGFSVASHDMDIRGSGNLLGDEQSGHIKETGVELYQQMLLETIEELKNTNQNNNLISSINLDQEFSVTIKLGISLLIPEKYIEDLSLRMNFYKKIALVKNSDAQDEIINELNDRFGKIPQEVHNLIEVAKLKWLCKKLGVERMEISQGGIVISFKDNNFSKPDNLLQMVFSSKNQIKIHQGHKILFMCDISSELAK